MAASTDPVCGNCHFARPVPVDLNNLAAAQQLFGKRLCAGVPPTPILIGNQVAQARPNMDVDEPACALWKRKFDVVV